MITTKKGDSGKTICGKKKRWKDDLLVEVIGSIDELQAILILTADCQNIVDDLFAIMGELGAGVKFKEIEKNILEMEKKIVKNSNIEGFVKFSKNKAATFNWARSVCRRVERKVVSLSKKESINNKIIIYFNRLSDYLFIKAIENN
jgi:cob(I)alamin adenosyltransferase